MASPDDDSNGSGPPRGCAGCGAALSGDQRYCLGCGARRGPLPPTIAARLAAPLSGEGDAESPPGEPGADDPPSARHLPSPRAAAVLVMCMLAFGVVLGSGTSQLAQSAGLSSVVLEVASSPPPEESQVEAVAAAPAAAAEAGPLPLPATASSAPFAPAPVEEAAAPVGEPAPEPAPPPELPEAETLPPVKHVFLIVLGENGYEEAFGPTSTAPYLAHALRGQGELLPNYYAVTKGDLANQIALLSGQGPTLETAADCPDYADIVPGTVATSGQVEGGGCVYPAATPTLPAQLAEKELKWRAYVEDIGNGAAAGAAATCRHPTLGGPDSSAAPLPGDAYVTWRNPIVYFHSLLDSPECAEDDVGLERLATDLKSAKKTPALAYIVPDACHDGGELPCEPGQPAGPLAAEAFLQAVVPEIEASPAYKEGGLIAITSAQAPQAGPKVDTSACCIDPVFPNLPAATAAEPAAGPVKPTGGGGRVGLLLISPFVAPGTSDEAGYYNHYSLLFSIEELFGLQRIGYASEEALTAFDSSVYNAGESTAPSAAGSATGSRAIRALMRGIEQQRQLPGLRQQDPAG